MISTLSIINDHLCPNCGHRIGLHVNSPFNNNPRIDDIDSFDYGGECNRTYSSLVIEKLDMWWNDAKNERDAYMKSYEEASKDKSDYFDAFLKMTTIASNATHDRDMYQKKLDIALNAFDDILEFKRTGYFGLNFDVWQIIQKVIIEVEKIK